MTNQYLAGVVVSLSKVTTTSLMIRSLKEKTMSEIPRWEVGFSQMNENDQGEFVTWNDHVAALKAARNELPDVGSWTPEAEFKVGDRVLLDDKSEFLIVASRFSCGSLDWLYDLSTVSGKPVTRVSASRIKLYVPPTPAELIPTLKEHEWVRGTYKTGIAFGPYSVYYNEIGAMFAGDNNLIHWNTGRISDELATLERCDAPEVK
jgi:hypothetical protein